MGMLLYIYIGKQKATKIKKNYKYENRYSFWNKPKHINDTSNHTFSVMLDFFCGKQCAIKMSQMYEKHNVPPAANMTKK